MKLQLYYAFAFVLCLFIIEISAKKRYSDPDDDDDEYSQLKRFLFHKQTTNKPSSSPSVLDNLVRPSSFSPSLWTVKTTNSPWYPSSGVCSSNPCEHGGICNAKGQNTFDCKCVGPWRGIYCGIVDACYRSPCENGGSCLNIYDDYWCKCSNDYYGKNCESKFYNPGESTNNCRPNICNTGRCVSLKTTYYCSCPEDRYGEHCEKPFNFYKRNPADKRSFYQLLNQIERDVADSNLDDSNEIDTEK
ncbi:unnamed protein product [Rotaria magnacalcarata]|uniref:EGF-like domain-containing protein n=3 Tax=Rotaria magnacalcarata TaxID=392030 RepID=A0A819ATJ4_9BILA|nr:unnamed protein product [Rotaria magnacalcarata]CAF1452028.1 unnamed protein product [Rotaria magnacalcarata]CAF1950696.1 unnamed protein product [Rotaria magnacalcarata]CAF2156536.1 unnamed protein product [Rotaria magnacalcarata]CAF3790871.1 unnamed protein product [Rotaria magnacalcarata]